MNVGSELRRARQARGLSVESLAAITRIQPRVLEGIERNDLSVVPPPPYARGFVTAYAREVGWDPEQTVREYFAQFDMPHLPAEGSPPEAGPASLPNSRSLMTLAAVSVLAVSVLFVMWTPREVAPRDTDAVGTTGTLPRATLEPAATDVAPADAAPLPATGPREGIVVVLEVDDAAWIAATADGTRVLYRTLEAGARETLHARREITLRVGNAGAVRLSIDGGAAAPMGRRGEVRVVTLRDQATKSLIPNP